mmetsp:Transcript_131006/g.318315  ORF Transcript_131006/g.318315 Transcript_131006/m.318315 type:complete len:218 (+) Transcript_131006:593-1246(+)
MVPMVGFMTCAVHWVFGAGGHSTVVGTALPWLGQQRRSLRRWLLPRIVWRHGRCHSCAAAAGLSHVAGWTRCAGRKQQSSRGGAAGRHQGAVGDMGGVCRVRRSAGGGADGRRRVGMGGASRVRLIVVGGTGVRRRGTVAGSTRTLCDIAGPAAGRHGGTVGRGGRRGCAGRKRGWRHRGANAGLRHHGAAGIDGSGCRRAVRGICARQSHIIGRAR